MHKRFNENLAHYRVKKNEVLMVTGLDFDRVMLAHRDGSTRSFCPARKVRDRLAVYEARPIEIRVGERIRWTRSDSKRSLIVGECAEVVGMDRGRVELRVSEGRGLSLGVDDVQLRHVEHGWSRKLQGAQRSTADGVIAVLDSSRGAVTDQAAFYVEMSKRRRRAVVLTDNAEQLVKVLVDATGEWPTVIEAVDAPAELEAEEVVRLLAVDDAVVEFHRLRREVVGQAEAQGEILVYAEQYGDLVKWAGEVAKLCSVPAGALRVSGANSGGAQAGRHLSRGRRYDDAPSARQGL